MSWLDPFFLAVSNLFVNGTQATKERGANLIAGSGVTITAVDNSALSRTDITIVASGGSGTLGTRFTLEQYDSNAGSSATYNCSAALASALSAAGAAATASATGTAAIELGFGKTYYVPSGATVPAGVTIIGHGDSSALYTTATAPVLTIGGSGITLRDFQFVGSLSGTPSGNPNAQDAINNDTGSSYSNLKLLDLTFTAMSGCGLRHGNTYTSYDCVNAVNCRFDHCAAAVFTDVRGEYLSMIGCVATTCFYGFWFTGGNYNVSGTRATNCTYAVQLEPGTNDSHGVFSGCTFNHNNVPVHMNAIANGCLFIGCEIYYGPISILGAQGVVFQGCEIDIPYWVVDVGTGTSASCVVRGCNFAGSVGAPPLVVDHTTSNPPPASCWIDFSDGNTYALTDKDTDNTAAGSGLTIKGLRSTVTTTALTLTASNLTAGIVPSWTTATSTQALVGASLITPYSAGVWTCGGWGRGRTTVRAVISLTKNAADSFDNLDVQLQLNGTTVRHAPIKNTSTTTGFAQLDCDIETKSTDTLQIKFLDTGSAFANSITVNASGTSIIVEGL